MFVVMHYLEPVACFADPKQAEQYADAIGADVYRVPVVLIDHTAPQLSQRPTDGD